MSLPAAWIDSLFARLTLTYGQSFLRMYDGLEIADVKANWARELAVFKSNPDAIKYALEYLPADKAPSVLQFRDICRRAPEPVVPALPQPKPDPAVAQEVRKVFQGVSAAAGSRGWAQALQRKEESGGELTQFQRNAWREALGIRPEGNPQ